MDLVGLGDKHGSLSEVIEYNKRHLKSSQPRDAQSRSSTEA